MYVVLVGLIGQVRYLNSSRDGSLALQTNLGIGSEAEARGMASILIPSSNASGGDFG